MSFGQKATLKVSLLLSVSLFYRLHHGTYKGHQKCSLWHGKCDKCAKNIRWTQGVFCANYWWKWGDFPPCKKAWCGKCYTSNHQIKFHIDHLDNSAFDDVGTEDKTRLEAAWSRKHYSKTDYNEARNGDHIMTPFECDYCIFIKLRGHYPNYQNHSDRLLLGCIRRANLDAFWSRSSATVNRNRNLINQQLSLSERLGLKGPFLHEGPMPSHDHCGFEIAVSMLLKSKDTNGKHSKSYLQFDTIRKLRSSYGSQVRASPQSNTVKLSLVDEKGYYRRMVMDVCGSLWFSRFIEGCKSRMGKIHKPNQAMSTKLLIIMLQEGEMKIEKSTRLEDVHDLAIFIVYVVACYCLSLRGNEGFMLDLRTIRKFKRPSTDSYVIFSLLGRVKGERNQCTHLIPCTTVTKSGIQVQDILNRAIAIKERFGFADGPLISSTSGSIWNARDIDDIMSDLLVKIFQEHKHLFPPEIISEEEVITGYQCFRTFRRISNTRAMEEKISSTDIDIINRWKKVEAAKGKRANLPMKHHYAEISILLGPFMRYTKAM